MALIRALNSAISGLNAHQFRIDTIGNNLANVDTTGFKRARTNFQTIFSQTISSGTAPQGFLGGIDPRQLGLGVQVADTNSDFTQGSLKSTGVTSDLAVEGDGFFVLNSVDGTPVYTRDGAFSINPENYLHNTTNGYIVQGWMADLNTFNVTSGGPLENIQIPIGDLTIAQETSTASFDGNLNSGGEIASSGSVLESETMWDFNAGAQATLNTALTDLGKGVGVLATSLGLSSGDVIEFTANKGGSSLATKTFEISANPPTNGVDDTGTTLGDLIDFMQDSIGINSSGDDTYSDVVTSGTVSANDTLTAASPNEYIADPIAGSIDFRALGVEEGDFIRFVAGDGTGQIAQILTIADNGAGTNNHLTFASPLDVTQSFPTTGSTWEINESAKVALGTSAAPPFADTRYDGSSADGVIRIMGNAGVHNGISNIEITKQNSGPLFLFSETQAAVGESTKTSATYYDSLGDAHLVEMSFVLQSQNNDGVQFRWFAESEDNFGTSNVVGTGLVNYDVNGQFVSQTPGAAISIDLQNTGSNTPLIVSPDFTNTTAFSSLTSEMAVTDQDGFEEGTLSDYAISADGMITGIFSNGLTRNIGQVALARFQNNNGLKAVGQNLYAADTNSGLAVVGTPGTMARGQIRSGFLEESNVDIAREFTELIVSQRAFQANARTITVSNEMLRDLVNII